MKNKNVKIIVGVIVGLVLIFSVYFITRKTYSIQLPKLSEIVSLNYTANSKSQLIGDSSIISNVYYTLKQIDKTTVKSENEKAKYGVNQIILYNTDSIGAILYLYEENNQYYLEQPNNGIFKISKETYEKIQNYLK